MSDPFRFQDVFKRIIEVGWGETGGIAIIELRYHKAKSGDASGHRVTILPNASYIKGEMAGGLNVPEKSWTPWPPEAPWGDPALGDTKYGFQLPLQKVVETEDGTITWTIIKVGKYFVGASNGAVITFMEDAFGDQCPFYVNWDGGAAPSPNIPPNVVDAHCEYVALYTYGAPSPGMGVITGWPVLAEILESETITDSDTSYDTIASRFLIVHLSKMKAEIVPALTEWVFRVETESADPYTVIIETEVNIATFLKLSDFEFKIADQLRYVFSTGDPIDFDTAEAQGNAEVVTPTKSAQFTINLTTFDISATDFEDA